MTAPIAAIAANTINAVRTGEPPLFFEAPALREETAKDVVMRPGPLLNRLALETVDRAASASRLCFSALSLRLCASRSRLRLSASRSRA
jgi:hypothetical protein